jgi:hypothetical protein
MSMDVGESSHCNSYLEARGDWTDDERTDVVMDSAYLQTALELDDPQNPFSCFPPPLGIHHFEILALE